MITQFCKMSTFYYSTKQGMINMQKTPKERYWEIQNPKLQKVGRKIEEFRLKKGFKTKESLAYAAGISIYYYYRMIKGTANISLLQLIKLCDTLEIKVKSLIDF